MLRPRRPDDEPEGADRARKARALDRCRRRGHRPGLLRDAAAGAARRAIQQGGPSPSPGRERRAQGRCDAVQVLQHQRDPRRTRHPLHPGLQAAHQIPGRSRNGGGCTPPEGWPSPRFPRRRGPARAVVVRVGGFPVDRGTDPNRETTRPGRGLDGRSNAARGSQARPRDARRPEPSSRYGRRETGPPSRAPPAPSRLPRRPGGTSSLDRSRRGGWRRLRHPLLRQPPSAAARSSSSGNWNAASGSAARE